MGGPYISSGSLEELPTPPLWAAHSGCHYQAGVNGLQLMSSTTSTALSYCHWLPATEQWHQSSEGMAKQKIKIINLYWKGAGKGNVDAAARGHEAQGG